MTVPRFVGDVLTGVHCVALQRKNNWLFAAQRGFLCHDPVRAAWIGCAALGQFPPNLSEEIYMTNQAQQPVVAAPIPGLSEQQQNIAADCGSRYFQAKWDAIETARVYARDVLGIDPTYEQFEQGRISWVNGYIEANPENTGNAADAAWKQFLALLSELFGISPVKPKSDNKGATKKRTERAAKIEKLVQHYTEGGTKSARDLEGMRMAAFEAAAKGNSAAEKIADELKTVLRVVNSEQNKELGEQRKELRKNVRAAAGKCSSIERLQQALDILDEENAVLFDSVEDEEDED